MHSQEAFGTINQTWNAAETLSIIVYTLFFMWSVLGYQLNLVICHLLSIIQMSVPYAIYSIQNAVTSDAFKCTMMHHMRHSTLNLRGSPKYWILLWVLWSCFIFWLFLLYINILNLWDVPFVLAGVSVLTWYVFNLRSIKVF